jgi:beta-galactosidase
MALGALAVILLLQAAEAKEVAARPHWPGPGQLFVGTCYQPIERSPEEVDRDIALMRKAGFNVVRLGDLSWDSFEPAPGKFDFSGWDRIIGQMHAAGIGVILDIPGTPAPLWLHRRYPGVDVVNQDGVRLPPAERYMDDISDPAYVREVKILANAITRHYAHDPAILALGYDNEIGNGFMSYSAADRERFIGWLRQRYGTVGALNRAWQTEWWSRRLDRFGDVYMPLQYGPGPSEGYLDLHRYWSDVTVARLEELDAIRRRNMPQVPAISNLWPTAPRRGFDYLDTYKSYVSYGAEGFYPGDPISGAFGALMMKGDLRTPIWFNEFTAGGGGYYGTPGRSRMYAYLGLLLGAQGFLAWTFNSHLGGEEQALFGLLDHDGTPSWKLWEWARIASEFRTLEKLGFPRYTRPPVAIAYSFDSAIDSDPNGPNNTTRQYFRPPYLVQVLGAFAPLFRDNLDTAIVDVAHADLSRYRLLVVPADYLMDPPSARAIRDYVSRGGTAIMTAFSAKVDEHGNWFGTPLPGTLSDVFGLRTSAFYRRDSTLKYVLNGVPVDTGVHLYEVLQPSTATVLARFSNTPDHAPAITINRFGRGRAIYLATWSKASAIGPLLRYSYGIAGIDPGPKTPSGVYARVVDGRTLYVNTTRQVQRISVGGRWNGVITHRDYAGSIVLGPWGVDLVQRPAARHQATSGASSGSDPSPLKAIGRVGR